MDLTLEPQKENIFIMLYTCEVMQHKIRYINKIQNIMNNRNDFHFTSYPHYYSIIYMLAARIELGIKELEISYTQI